MGKGKDIGMMLIAGLKKKKGDGPVEDDEDLASDDGPEYDPDTEGKKKAARAVRIAIQEKDDTALCEALDAYLES